MLLEVAIGLAILGVILGLSLPLMSHYQQSERLRVTQAHQEMILSALGAYGGHYEELPCPANPYDDSGEAQAICPKSSECVGSVPYKTLGLPKSITLDGYGNPMIYAVEPQFTNKESICLKDISTRLLTVLDAKQRSVLSNNEGPALAVVLLSQGRAFKDPKGREVENLDKTPRFFDLPFSDNPDQPFRHILKWATRDVLLSYYGHSGCAKQSPDSSHTSSQQSPIDPLLGEG